MPQLVDGVRYGKNQPQYPVNFAQPVTLIEESAVEKERVTGYRKEHEQVHGQR